MAEKQRTEISAELLAAVRELAERQGRPESAVLEEAVAAYLVSHAPEAYWGDIVSDTLGADPGEVEVGAGSRASDAARNDGFFALLGRMGSRFDLDEGEAERIAVEEQHAWRRERREQAGGDRAAR